MDGLSQDLNSIPVGCRMGISKINRLMLCSSSAKGLRALLKMYENYGDDYDTSIILTKVQNWLGFKLFYHCWYNFQTIFYTCNKKDKNLPNTYPLSQHVLTTFIFMSMNLVKIPNICLCEEWVKGLLNYHQAKSLVLLAKLRLLKLFINTTNNKTYRCCAHHPQETTT